MQGPQSACLIRVRLLLFGPGPNYNLHLQSALALNGGLLYGMEIGGLVTVFSTGQ